MPRAEASRPENTVPNNVMGSASSMCRHLSEPQHVLQNWADLHAHCKLPSPSYSLNSPRSHSIALHTCPFPFPGLQPQ